MLLCRLPERERNSARRSWRCSESGRRFACGEFRAVVGFRYMECMRSTARAFDPDHPLLHDRPHLDRILDAMFWAIQKQLYLRAPGRRGEPGADPALLGGVSVDDVLQEAFEDLLQHPHDGFSGSWEALGVDIAKKRAIDAWQASQAWLHETDHRPALTVISGDSDVTGDDGEPVGTVISAVPSTEPTPEERCLALEEEYRSACRTQELQDLAREKLTERELKVFFGVVFQDRTHKDIGEELGVTGQWVGKILNKAFKKLEQDPRYPYESRR